MLRIVLLVFALLALTTSASLGSPQEDLRDFGLRMRASLDSSEPIASALKKREDIDALVTFVNSTSICSLALGSTRGELDLLQLVTEQERRAAARRYVAAGTLELLDALNTQVDQVNFVITVASNKELLDILREYVGTLDDIVSYYKELAKMLEDTSRDLWDD